jgi:predicted nucleotidyltransferase
MKFDWQKYTGNLDWLEHGTILLVLSGSHAYGLATETSDYDWRGVCIPPKEYFSGWLHKFEQADKFTTTDCTIFDIRKFFALACDGNPNILDILWSDRVDDITTFGWALRGFRQSFLSRKIKYAFAGHAIAQLKRIKTHKKWLLNPPDHKPLRAEFELPETSLLSPDLRGAIESLESRLPEFSLQDLGVNVMHVYQRERAYHNALREWQQYENWKANRNAQRAELEKKFGYDTKHAMHLVRLLRMGAEILETGEVIVERPDREELLEIRGGAWSYDRIIAYAEEMDARLDELEEKSSLPPTPNRVYLDNVCRELVESFHGWLR